MTKHRHSARLALCLALAARADIAAAALADEIQVVPMSCGLVVGSAIGAGLARHTSPVILVRLGLTGVTVGVATNLAYNALFAAAVPWAVIPIMISTLGLGLLAPNMTLMAIDLLPQMRGMVSSLLNFIRMLVFSAVSGIVMP